ncbi:MAG: asparagine synthase B [Planctomycetota bacterium]
MCGIAGLWGRRDERAVRDMMAELRHRGPDASGMHTCDRGALGHRRLSIMDPAGGDQPIYNETGELAIVANGEIYNFPALRADLAARHTLRTGNDSESVVHLYEDRATGAAAALDGMFAFALTDGADVFLARDPIGIKPLYYGRRHAGLIFASELKALAPHARDVREFPAGTWYHSTAGFGRFYDVPDRQPVDRPADEHARLIRGALERAVGKRMMSDVPVGAFLSGGLDSSIICALVRRHVDRLHTFSVGIEGSADIEAARRVAHHLDTIHHEYLLTSEEVRAKLPEIVYHLESYDQDLVRSAIPCYFTSRLAARYVKVILTGEGADELFAGYTYYRDIDDEGALHRELRRSVCSLHNVNLQRVDRLTMAHGLEGRVPLLDTELIELAQTVPAELKLRRMSDGRLVEKWILRTACEDLLPAEIIWRDKQQFDEGSGTVDLVSTGFEAVLPPDRAAGYAAEHPEAALRSREECAYHKLLSSAYGGSDVVMNNVARWSHRQCDVA